ncbi:MAG: SH3 domain-containing protein [Chloroflexota bacterium]
MNSDKQSDTREPVPWLWLGLGVALSLVLLVGAFIWLMSFLSQPPEETAVAQEPTILVLTAPPQPTSTPTVLRPTPTVLPTTTPQPTIDVSVAPPELTVGYYATVADTGGVGLTVRNGPSTRTVRIVVASEGSKVYVLDGPTDADSLQWWQIRLTDGTEGWAAGDFLVPAAGP